MYTVGLDSYQSNLKSIYFHPSTELFYARGGVGLEGHHHALATINCFQLLSKSQYSCSSTHAEDNHRSPTARFKRSLLSLIFPFVTSSSASNNVLIDSAKSYVRYNHIKERYSTYMLAE